MSGPKQYPRAERVRASIHQVLAGEVERMRDDVGFVTITAVTLTPDLRRARAYYTIMDEDAEPARAAITAATPQLRTAIARSVRMKFAPTLELIEDPVPARARRIDEIIADIHRDEGQTDDR